jgi:hypothetical protein
MAVNVLERFDAHPQKARGLPDVSPVQHEPRCCRVTEDMRRHILAQPSVGYGIPESDLNALHRLAVDLDSVLETHSRPTAHVSQKTVRDGYCWPALARLSGFLWPPVEHACVEVDERRRGHRFVA